MFRGLYEIEGVRNNDFTTWLRASKGGHALKLGWSEVVDLAREGYGKLI